MMEECEGYVSGGVGVVSNGSFSYLFLFVYCCWVFFLGL